MTSPPKKRGLDDPYQFGDAIPTPEALEKDTDTAWALFRALAENADAQSTAPGPAPPAVPPGDPAYAPTAPTGLQPAPEAAATQPAQSPDLEALMLEARRNNRVCPRLEDWQALYDMLPGKRQVDGQWEPPLPISPQAWRVTSSMIKRLCLRDHLEWAARHGAAGPVLALLRSLPEDHWLHVEH
ncbi:MAG: hypothetical protein ACXWJJ_12130 [Ramlibacter sp.]